MAVRHQFFLPQQALTLVLDPVKWTAASSTFFRQTSAKIASFVEGIGFIQ